MKRPQFLPKRKSPLVILIIFGVIAFLDLSNLDRYLHKGVCLALGVFFETVCPDFYDLPIWEVATTFGILVIAYFAYTAIDRPDRQA